MSAKLKTYYVDARVEVASQDGKLHARRNLPGFTVQAWNINNAHSQIRDILTASWLGPSTVKWFAGIASEMGRVWATSEAGLRELTIEENDQ